ncbi:MAG: hypothetical protein R3D03_01615 [Geminicoccaceae bacterium]
MSSNAGRAVGYNGAGYLAGTLDGKLLGRIRLPEVCGNVCFGGPKRNRLFSVRQPVHLCGLYRHAGCGSRLTMASRPGTRKVPGHSPWETVAFQEPDDWMIPGHPAGYRALSRGDLPHEAVADDDGRQVDDRMGILPTGTC